jgi:hypothetical protein
MSRIALILLSAAALLAADDPWAKVSARPNRSELRIYHKGVRDAITATLGTRLWRGYGCARHDTDRVGALVLARLAVPGVPLYDETAHWSNLCPRL